MIFILMCKNMHHYKLSLNTVVVRGAIKATVLPYSM